VSDGSDFGFLSHPHMFFVHSTITTAISCILYLATPPFQLKYVLLCQQLGPPLLAGACATRFVIYYCRVGHLHSRNTNNLHKNSVEQNYSFRNMLEIHRYHAHL
jgi:hypothetical protein